MLLKLLKYDFLYSKNTFFGIIILSFVFALYAGIQVDLPEQFLFAALIIGIIFSLLFTAAAIFSVVTLSNNFNKNLLSEHGYLMLTLPVKKEFLVMSKYIISVFWFNVMLVVAVICLLIIAAMHGEDVLAVVREIGDFIDIDFFLIYIHINLYATSFISLVFFVLALARSKVLIKFNMFIALVVGLSMFIANIVIMFNIIVSLEFGFAGQRFWLALVSICLYFGVVYLLKNKIELE